MNLRVHSIEALDSARGHTQLPPQNVKEARARDGIVCLLQVHEHAVQGVSPRPGQLEGSLQNDTVVLNPVMLPETCLGLGPRGRGVGFQPPHHHLAEQPAPRVHQ